VLCHTGEVLAAGSQTPASEEWTPQGGECCCSRKARAIKNVIRKVPGWNLSGTAGFTPRRTGDIREACGILCAHIPVGCLAIVDSRQTVSCEIDPGWSPSAYRSSCRWRRKRVPKWRRSGPLPREPFGVSLSLFSEVLSGTARSRQGRAVVGRGEANAGATGCTGLYRSPAMSRNPNSYCAPTRLVGSDG
jgi:hypothetical protein